MTMRQITKEEATAAHYDLLLEADPSRLALEDYLKRGIIYEKKHNQQLVGVLVLLATRPKTLEIVNIAIHPDCQNKKLGQKLLQFAIDYAKSHAFDTLEIGTGSTSFMQLYLYQKVGFRLTHIDRDFFLIHYSEPIIENNLVLKDMVRLSMTL